MKISQLPIARFRSTVLGGSAALLLAGTVGAQSFTALPTDVYSARDITPDGEIVVGSGSGGAYYWRWRVDPAPTYIGAQDAVAVSDDGSVVAGNMADPVTGLKVAARWTQATGWVPLGGLYGDCSGTLSSAYDMSADGSKIVGLGWNSCKGMAFLWQAGVGMKEFEWVGDERNRASAISADGTVAVGFAQGNFSRTPARWTTSDQLGVVPEMDDTGEYFGVSDDGSIRLGGRNGYAFFEQNGVETNIGNLNPGWTGRAVDVSESGGTIIGYDVLTGGTEAWVWNPVTGIQSLQNRLSSLGVPNVPYMGYASAITPDGKVVVGQTQWQGAWIAEIPPGPIATPYGCGFSNPPESLTHMAGSSSVGSSIMLGVDDPTGSTVAPAFGIAFFSTQPDPSYPCGTPLPGYAMFGSTGELLVSLAGANPFMQQVSPSLWMTASQPVPVNLAIPFDLNLFGVDVYAQGALFTPSTMKVGLTNGMRITIGLN